MSVSLYDHFVETIEHVPSELQRNFELMTELDKRSEEFVKKINQNVFNYRNTTRKSERSIIYKETMDMFDKARGFADDKIELAKQTYDLVDKHIRRLDVMGPSPSISNTNPPVQNTNGDNLDNATFEAMPVNMPVDDDEPRYCTCNGVSHGEMIACDNKDCPIEWFHFECVNITIKPKGKWYCPNCFNTSKSSKNRFKKQKLS